MDKDLDTQLADAPLRSRLPSAQQVGTALAALSLAGPAALGGMPALPATVHDDQRRRQEAIGQVTESSVGIYQTSAEAQAGLVMSQQRLAAVTREIDDIRTHDVSEQDIVHAANRVFAGQVEGKLGTRFKSALGHVATDTVDLFILKDNEEYARRELQRP